jgi:hypothetical protein
MRLDKVSVFRDELLFSGKVLDISIQSGSYSGGYYSSSIEPVALPEVPKTYSLPAPVASTGAASVKKHRWQG